MNEFSLEEFVYGSTSPIKAEIGVTSELPDCQLLIQSTSDFKPKSSSCSEQEERMEDPYTVSMLQKALLSCL